jgi:DNA polymerase III subunit delta
MSTATERALQKAMHERTFDRVYYFHGEDDYRKEQAARSLVTAALEASTRDFNYDALYGPGVSPQELEGTLATPPMLAKRRVITLRDVHLLARNARAVLNTYLDHPAADVLLVLVSPAGEKSDSALVEAAVAIEFASLSAEQVLRWIVRHASTELGADVTDGAASLLRDAVGADLALLAAELDKLASYTSGAVITEETITAVVGVRRGESLAELLDAVADRDAARAVSLVEPVLMQPKMSAVAVLMALATQTLAIGCGCARNDEGGRRFSERDYFSLLRDSRVYPSRSWGDAVAAWTRGTRLWSTAATEEGMELLLAADHAAKETRLSSDAQLLTSLVLELCTTGDRAVA